MRTGGLGAPVRLHVGGVGERLGADQERRDASAAWALSSQLSGSSGSGSSRMMRCPPRVSMMRTAQSGACGRAERVQFLGEQCTVHRKIDSCGRSRQPVEVCLGGARAAPVGAQALKHPVTANQPVVEHGACGLARGAHSSPSIMMRGAVGPVINATFCPMLSIMLILATARAATVLERRYRAGHARRTGGGRCAGTASTSGTRLHDYADLLEFPPVTMQSGRVSSALSAGHALSGCIFSVARRGRWSLASPEPAVAGMVVSALSVCACTRPRDRRPRRRWAAPARAGLPQMRKGANWHDRAW